jgi:hypothetical protein
MQTRMEAATPMPLVDVDRDASALAYRTDADVVIVDVPSYLVRIV